MYPSRSRRSSAAWGLPPSKSSTWRTRHQEHLFGRGFLEHLAERDPEATLDLIDLFAFRGMRGFGFEMTQELAARLERSERIETVARRRPELIALSRLVSPGMSDQVLEKLDQQLFEAILSPGVLIDVVERRPDAAVLLLMRFATKAGLVDVRRSSKARRRNPDRLLYPPLLVQICEQTEAAGVEFLRLLQVIFPPEALRQYFDELCDMLGRGSRLAEYISLKPLVIVELFRLSAGLRSTPPGAPDLRGHDGSS